MFEEILLFLMKGSLIYHLSIYYQSIIYQEPVGEQWLRTRHSTKPWSHKGIYNIILSFQKLSVSWLR